MLCYLRALLFKNSWYHYVILQRWGLPFNLRRVRRKLLFNSPLAQALLSPLRPRPRKLQVRHVDRFSALHS